MFVRSCLALAVVATLSSALPTSHVPEDFETATFDKFLIQFGKKYDAREYQVRKSIFESNLEMIKQHNAHSTSHFKTINKFADVSAAEMKSMFGFDRSLGEHRRMLRHGPQFFNTMNRNPSRVSDLPASVDWTTTGALTPVKNQGGCGSCWAFAGTEAIEASVYLNTGKLFTFAPQVYVDCVTNPDQCGGSGGCEGSTPDTLFGWAVKNGAYLEKDFPYQARDETCNVTSTPVAVIAGWEDVPTNDVAALMRAVSQQPVTIGVTANNWGLYGGGVFNFTDCDSDLNHAVLLVGYGTDPVFGDYWKVQNSWGPDWGESGFIRLARHSDDGTRCQTDSKPADGFGCKDGPKEVQVCGTCGILYLPSYPVGGKIVRN